MTAKIIKLQANAFQEFLQTLEQGYHDGRLKTLICIAQIEFPPEQKKPEVSYQLRDYWFGGDSCVECLGLLEVMKGRILDYMDDA